MVVSFKRKPELMPSTVAGFEIVEQIYESSSTLIFRAVRPAGIEPEDGQDGQGSESTVVLKMLKPDAANPVQRTRYRQEYAILVRLEIEGVIRAHRLATHGQSPVIVLEDCASRSLDVAYPGQRPDVAEFLSLAIAIADTLSGIHDAGLIHKDINPSNILWNPDTNVVKLIDFGSATRLTQETQLLQSPGHLEGTLAYVSPEQTGRMNRSLDYRTDLYSLGCTFYELLAARPPFFGGDPLALVHAHLARQPEPLCIVDPSVPMVLSDLIAKLMAKNAEDRYQSAVGAAADLRACREQLERDGGIGSFALGRNDPSDRLWIPQRLYGREREVAALLSAFERVAGGDRELMLVSGYSGIGKTTLVQELYKPITARRGFFISGKFDQYQRTIPYSAPIRAFTELVRQILGESAAELDRWRARLLAVLGDLGHVVVEVIPELELIVGVQPSVPELGPIATQNRFNLVFRRFVRAFSAPEHPVAIFLDDLQWADAASLTLIELMMSDDELTHLLVIGAYRENEVSSNHPLMPAVERLRQTGVPIEHLEVGPLSGAHLHEIVTATLRRDDDGTFHLARIITQKTAGNPFFVGVFLKEMFARRLLTFDRAGQRWSYDRLRVEQADLTDNVAELVIGKLKTLPVDLQEMLSLAAFVGLEFDLDAVSLASGQPRRVVFELALAAIRADAIVAISDLTEDLVVERFRFDHDRIQQAAYELTKESRRPEIHHRIGRALLDYLDSDTRRERVFEIVDHLNLAQSRLKTEGERLELANLNLVAALQAKDAAAHAAARAYLATGESILPNTVWETDYELAFALCKTMAELEYIDWDGERFEKRCQHILANTRSVIDKTQIYEIMIDQYTNVMDFDRALSSAFSGLKFLGFSINFKIESIGAKDVEVEIQETASVAKRVDYESFLHLPMVTDRSVLAALRLLSSCIAASYSKDFRLYQVIISRMFRLTIEHGISDSAPLAIASYGLLVSSTSNDIDAGYRYGQLALELWERHDLKGDVLAYNGVCSYIYPWKAHIRDTNEPRRHGIDLGIRSGQLAAVGYLILNDLTTRYYSGAPLAEVLQLYSEHVSTLAAMGHGAMIQCLSHYRETFEAMTGDKAIGDQTADERLFAMLEAAGDTTELFHQHLIRGISHWFFGDASTAFSYFRGAHRHLAGAAGHYGSALCAFYGSLSALSWLSGEVGPSEESDGTTRVEIEAEIERDQDRMRLWARHAPMNYQHKYDLVEAERHRLRGDKVAAMEAYSRAIAGARVHEFLNEEALANELAARFYLGWGMPRIARAHMSDARHAYARWGAAAKVRDLDERYPELLAVEPEPASRKGTQTGSTETVAAAALDLTAVVRAAQAIAEELALDRLLDRLLRIVIENAGAGRGALVLPRDGTWVVEAKAAADDAAAGVLMAVAIEDATTVSAGIVNFVARTAETVLLDRASAEGQFVNDPHVRTQGTLSVLCAPLLNRGKLSAILYLENNLAAGAFTADRLELVRLLSGQAAIAIDHARLYAELEDKVAERTAELSSTVEALRTAQSGLVQAETMAALGRVVAGVAHEINTPIGICKAAASTIDEDIRALGAAAEAGQLTCDRLAKLNDRLLEGAALLMRNVDRAGELIHTFRQTAADQTSDEIRTIDLTTYVRDVAYTMVPALRRTLHTLSVDGPEPMTTTTHPGALAQIVTNLLTNALTHAFPDNSARTGHTDAPDLATGHISLTLSDLGAHQATKDGDAHDGRRRVALVYADDGVGMDEATRRRIFEPFFTTRRSAGSTGLGLHIVHNLVVGKLGGTISCTSQPGNGTIIEIVFPVIATRGISPPSLAG